MSFKKGEEAREVGLPRQVDYTRAFLKDWQRLSRSGRFNMKRLKEAMLLLIAGETLGAQWGEHPLKGEWAGHRECHIGGDFLLAYKLQTHPPPGCLIFVRAGTHAELFE